MVIRVKRNDSMDSMESNSKKVKLESSVSILDKLRSQNYYEGLLEMCQREKVEEFFSLGGLISDLIPPLENKIKANESVKIFNACESVLLFVSSSKTQINFGVGLTRKILGDFSKSLHLLLSISNTATQTSSVLKLLSSMVLVSEVCAKEILAFLDFDNSTFESLPNRRNETFQNVRKDYIHFLLSFFIGSNSRTRVDFLTKHKKFHFIFPGLIRDSLRTIELLLNSLTVHVLQNTLVPKTLKMKIFGLHSIQAFLSLLNGEWKGSAEEHETGDEEKVSQITFDFLSLLLTSVKFGVIFKDSSCGSSGTNCNPLLLSVLRSIGKPWEKDNSELLSSLVISSLACSPDQIRPYFSTLEITPPRNSEPWLQFMFFCQGIFRQISWNDFEGCSSKVKRIIFSSIAFPEILLSTLISPSLISEDEVVLEAGIELFASMMTSVKGNISKLDTYNQIKVIARIKNKFPKFEILLSLWHNLQNERLLEKEVVLLDFYMEFLGASALFESLMKTQISSNVNMLPLLKHSLKNGVQNPQIYYSLSLLTLILEASDTILSFSILQTLLADAGLCDSPSELRVVIPRDKAHVQEFASLLSEALTNKNTLISQAHQIHEEFFHFKNQRTDGNLEELFERLLDSHFNEEEFSLVDNNSCCCSPLLSPLSLFLASSSNKVSSSFLSFLLVSLERLLYLSEDPLLTSEFLLKQFYFSSSYLFSLCNSLLESQINELEISSNVYQIWTLIKLGRRDLETHLKAHLTPDSLKFIVSQKSFVNLFTPFTPPFETSALILSLCPQNLRGSLKDIFLRDFFKGKWTECSSSLISDIFSTLSFCTPELLQMAESLLLDFDLVEKSEYCRSLIWKRTLSSLSSPLTAHEIQLEKNERFMRLFESVLKDQGSELLEVFTEYFKVRTTRNIETLLSKKHLEIALTGSSINYSCGKFIELMVSSNINNSRRFFQKYVLKTPEILLFSSLLPAVTASLSDPKTKSSYISVILDVLSDKIHDYLNGTNTEGVFTQDLIHQLSFHELSFPLTKYKTARNLSPNAIQALFALSKSFDINALEPALRSLTLKLGDESLDDTLIVSLINSIDSVVTEKHVRLLRQTCKKDWDLFVKKSLKYGLKGRHSFLLSFLSGLLSLYSEEEDKAFIYDLITSHSHFLPILLNSETGKGKEEMTKLLDTLLDSSYSSSNQLLHSSHLPFYLGSYSGSLSLSDIYLLRILRRHEEKFGLSSPCLWGPESLSGKERSLSTIPSVSTLLSRLEKDKLINSSISFPLNIKLNETPPTIESYFDSNNYDPRFILPYLLSLISSTSYIARHYKLFEILPLVFGALSSHDEAMRGLSYTLLSRIYGVIKSSKMNSEKKIWCHLLDILRVGVFESKSSKTDFLRLPFTVSLFLIRISSVLSTPSSSLYKSISSFVTSKPSLNCFNVPEFFRLFDSETLGRSWILKVMKDGFNDSLDYHIFQRDYIGRLLCTFVNSVMSSDSEKLLIVDLFEKALSLYSSCVDLIRNHGLLLWLLSLENPHFVFRLLKASLTTLSQSRKTSPSFFFDEIFLVLQHLSFKINVDELMTSLKSFHDITIFLPENNSKELLRGRQ